MVEPLVEAVIGKTAGGWRWIYSRAWDIYRGADEAIRARNRRGIESCAARISRQI